MNLLPQRSKVLLENFLGWFTVMMLWLPTTIGGWLVYFGVLSTAHMWLGSVSLSIVLAMYIAVQAVRKKY